MKNIARKSIFWVFLTLTTIILLECKKDSSISADKPNSERATLEIKKWLKLQEDTVNANKFLKQINWQQSYILKADSGLEYLVVPVPDTSKQVFNQEKVYRYIILEEQDQKASQGYVYEILGSESDLKTQEHELLKGYANIKISNNFSGNLSKFMLNGMLIESTEYVLGKLNAYKKLYTSRFEINKAIQGVKKRTNGCSDWWLIIYYTDGTETSTYLGRTCVCDQTQSLRDNKGLLSLKLLCAESGGSTSPPDGSSPPDCIIQSQKVKGGKLILAVVLPPCAPPPDPPKKVDIKLCPDFSPGEVSDFATTYNEIKDGNCLQQALVTALAETGRQVSICKGAVPGGAIASSGNNGNITWSSGLPFYVQTLTEELFHQVQFSAYGVGRSNVNIEFEAAVLRDMINNTRTAIDNGSDADKQEYAKWINGVTQYGTVMPHSINDIIPNNDSSTYFHLVDLYNNQYPAGNTHHGVPDGTLPNALVQVTIKCN